ncbi:MAG: Mrp/NBP35 family ATP-binding protein [Firmicutes bacterium]|nr:Mrp/NBP35 family ATP-binding protein [Bacillota bacterium]
MENCTHDCSSCGASCPSRDPASMKAPLNEFSSVKKVIGVVSGKGGVGKSMVSELIASTLQKQGLQTAILDADITGPSIPQAFGLHQSLRGSEMGMLPAKSDSGVDIVSVNLLLENETDPVVWRGPVMAGVIQQFWSETFWNDIDVMVVDMPPGTGDVPLTVFQSLPVDGLIIVTSPQDLVSMIVTKAINMAKMMNIPVLGIVENMSYLTCPDCGKKISLFGESHVEEVAAKNGLKVLGQIPIDPALAQAVDKGAIDNLNVNYLDGALDAIKALN